ncbi:YihY/virulence factor BrkB family protein [uncultured Amnibacterium sp.]|uniref:YihY/virulence factor BrkB family protein n=1 Tax=uncultured Amnibacterium sp. TaxID=1631851 RepID=UPI0035C9F412
MATRTASGPRRGTDSGGVQRAVGVSAISAGAIGIAAAAVGLVSTSSPRTTGSRPTQSVRATDTGEKSKGSDQKQSDQKQPDQKSGKQPEPSGGSGGRPSGGSDPSADSASSERASTAPAPEDSRKPEGPEDLKPKSWTYALKKVGREFGADKCTDLAASLVYYSVLALFPALLAIVSILGLFGQGKALASQLTQTIMTASPSTAGFIGPVLKELASSNAAGVTFVIGVLGALWSASGYVGAFGRAMNRIYDIDEGRPVWKLRPTQLGITVVVVLLVVLAALILLLSGPVVQAVGSAIGLGPVVVFIWGIVKWPILLAIVIAAIALLYYFSPNVRQPKFKWTSTGSIIAIVVLAIASVAFVFYLGNFANYNKTYGTLGGIIIFLLWLWIANLSLLFGAEWDAEVERGRELQGGIAAEEHIQLPPRDTSQADKKAKKHEEDVEQGRRLRESRGART